MNVVELFSGVGSQAKALERIGIDYDIIATCDWDINAIIAYDLIHNGEQLNNEYSDMTSVELTNELLKYNLSSNGKKPMTEKSVKRMSRVLKEKLLFAIKRSNNLIDITKVKGTDISENIDLLTYSFPCQDLSLAGNWHNNKGGINRNSGNRSSLLWEVERILYERRDAKLNCPRFLMMENVTALLSPKHRKNFEEWKKNLIDLGYYNKVYTLDARKFGVPQMRERTYMISILIDDLDHNRIKELIEHVENITDESISNIYPRNSFSINDALKTNYENERYLIEAQYSNPNITISRQNIEDNNIRINGETQYIPTITTKQDRHPNSGLIDFEIHEQGKMSFRYLTPRECFILMGFDEDDFQMLVDNDFNTARNRNFFTRDKLNKMAGNSICVNVLESIFEMINEINNIYFNG